MNYKDKLLKYAVYYLSKYSSSKKNLEFILKKKIRRLTEEKKIRYELYKEIENITHKLEQQKLLDDILFIDSKINYLLIQAKSKNYIKQYLIQKGVENKLADQQISIFYKNNINLEKDNALKFAKKKNLFNDNKDYEKKLAKMARAGFSYDICKKILN